MDVLEHDLEEAFRAPIEAMRSLVQKATQLRVADLFAQVSHHLLSAFAQHSAEDEVAVPLGIKHLGIDVPEQSAPRIADGFGNSIHGPKP
jgi:hypothetical protein